MRQNGGDAGCWAHWSAPAAHAPPKLHQRLWEEPLRVQEQSRSCSASAAVLSRVGGKRGEQDRAAGARP